MLNYITNRSHENVAKVAKFHQIWSHCPAGWQGLPSATDYPTILVLSNNSSPHVQCNEFVA